MNEEFSQNEEINKPEDESQTQNEQNSQNQAYNPNERLNQTQTNAQRQSYNPNNQAYNRYGNYNYNSNANYYLPPLPNSQAVLVLGIISIPTCLCYGVVGLICAIIALVLASSAEKLYRANPEMYQPSSYSNLKTGKTCAWIGIGLGAFALLCVILWFIFVIIMGVTFDHSRINDWSDTMNTFYSILNVIY